MSEAVAASKRKIIEDFNSVIEDAQKLLVALAASGEEKGSALHLSVEQSLQAARASLNELQDGALERTRETARATDEYVREHPWQSAGIVAFVAALAGFVIGLMMSRR